ncbi:hypothetical protein HDU90_005528 [Geranomyces variabilis]|nr:hypothetical protein HDU90_005528 [Geranomyces variabilis]
MDKTRGLSATGVATPHSVPSQPLRKAVSHILDGRKHGPNNFQDLKIGCALHAVIAHVVLLGDDNGDLQAIEAEYYHQRCADFEGPVTARERIAEAAGGNGIGRAGRAED